MIPLTSILILCSFLTWEASLRTRRPCPPRSNKIGGRLDGLAGTKLQYLSELVEK